MNSLNLQKLADLNEARTALEKLLPNLPLPRTAEQLDEGGVSLPKIGGDPTTLPVLENPRSLIAHVGPLVGKFVPDLWKPAYFAHQLRCRRMAQSARLQALCQHAGPSEFAVADGVVAGALLLCLQPAPGRLRDALMKRAAMQTWGSFFALHGMVLPAEQPALLNCVAQDSHLAASLWRTIPDLAQPLLKVALERCDLWSSMMILGQAQAGPWLQHVLAQGAGNGVAAVTALTLQPAVSRDIQIIWMDRLRLPHLAYWTARMTRHTWPPGKWQGLVEELRATAVSDRASAWYHWHRDIEPETIEAALREEDVEVLWQAELIHHARNCGQQLRRRMTIRLQANGCDREARLTLRWLNGRRRPDG